jgi:hypothetical protein
MDFIIFFCLEREHTDGYKSMDGLLIKVDN